MQTRFRPFIAPQFILLKKLIDKNIEDHKPDYGSTMLQVK